jgi:hypothetical protein
MLMYKSILESLTVYVELKHEYNSLLNSRVTILNMINNKLTSGVSNIDSKYSKDYIENQIKKCNKEIEADKFKLKYYDKYVDKITEILKAYFDENNIKFDDNFKFSSNIKSDILLYKKLKDNKSLHKKMVILFKDNGKEFNNDLIKPIEDNIKDIKKQIKDENKLANNVVEKHIDTRNIEAVPKKLAEEGERPNDNNPIGQKIYDLRLLFGFGEANSMKFVEQNITLEQLLNEWDRFTKLEKGNDILMKEKLPDRPNTNVNLPYHKRMDMRFSYLLERLKNAGCVGLYQCKYDQLVGIKHFEDISKKIPRDEIDKMVKYLNIVIKNINKDLIFTCCGSYRRGKDKSGDIDCLITHKDMKTIEDIQKWQQYNDVTIISLLVNSLTKTGFLTDHLKEGDKKYMGLCKLPNKKYKDHRRIDINLFPYNSYASALLYFTGSKNLNTKMRIKAINMGMLLNEHGLYKLKDKNGTEYKKDKRVHILTLTEKSIFDKLEMEYLEPHERNI